MLTGELFQAAPHRWGQGKVHGVKMAPFPFDDVVTLCGIDTGDCEGECREGGPAEINCKRCIKCIETEERRQRWREEMEERQKERDEENRRWWAWYEDYLSSPEWRERRAKVMRRADGRCEGCGEQDAQEVHHLTYDHVGEEFLFELVALCSGCHDRLHPEKRS